MDGRQPKHPPGHELRKRRPDLPGPTLQQQPHLQRPYRLPGGGRGLQVSNILDLILQSRNYWLERFTALCLCVTVAFGFPTNAQKASDLKGARFRLPAGVTSSDYQKGKVLVKLKPEYRDYFNGPNQLAASQKEVLKKIKPQSSSRVATDLEISTQNQRRGRAPSIDLSLYYELYLDPSVDIETAIDALYKLGVVEYAEPAYIARPSLVPNDPDLELQTYLDIIKAKEAWDISTGSDDIIVAIVDSGVDLDHPDLADIIYLNKADPPDNKIDDDQDGFVNNYLGWDFAGDDFNTLKPDNDPSVDDVLDPVNQFHGTLVAGCACAIADNDIGIAGVGFNCKIMVLKHVADNDTTDRFFGTSLGILYAANNGADIINLSFGGPTRSQFTQDIIEFATVDQGALVVASAGNNSNADPHYPSAYDYVISVASSASDDEIASFSNFRSTVDVIAPGVGIYGTAYDDEYTTQQGTSLSSPIVAGAAALVLAHYPEFSGMQIGELLRVSADPSIYDNVDPEFEKQLGLGRLDVLNALTVQPPSIRINSEPVLLNAEGNLAQAGDRATLRTGFINHLWPSSSALTVTLSTENTFVDITGGQSQIGSLGTNQTLQFTDQITLEIAGNIPENSDVLFLAEYSDGYYQDYEFFSILVVDPTFLNIEQNLVSTTVSNIGRLGFQDFNQNDGIGFIFNERNMLFEMGLMLGTSPSKISNTARTDEGETDDDFVQQSKIKAVEPGLYSDFEVVGSFNDQNAGASQSNVLINYRAMAFKDSPNDQYVIIEYNITNNGSDTLENFFAGLYADWNIEQASGNFTDIAGWDNDRRVGYAYSGAPDDDFYAGIQVLTGTPNYWAIDNDEDIPGGFGVNDGFTDAEKFQSLSSGIGREEAGATEEDGNDISHTVGAGPFSIPAGDSITVAFALHGAANLEELLVSAAYADTMYNVVLKAPVPEVEDVTVCFGTDGTLTAQGAESYNWYTSQTGGEAIASTDQITIENLVGDTTLYVANVYVANVGPNFESSRARGTIHVVPNPVLTASGPLVLCPGDSLVLTAEGGDSFLWSPNGETSGSITVTGAGVFSVTIISDSPSCEVTLEELEITQHPLPEADFDVDRTSELEVQLTDQSTDAVSWFWDFGDGNSSLEQNPSHTYAEAQDYNISLVVVSEMGCIDSTTVEVAIISNQVVIYPNPHSGRFTISISNQYLGEVSMGVYDLLGQEIKQTRLLKSSGQLNREFDVSNFPNGIYLVRISFGQSVLVNQILKN